MIRDDVGKIGEKLKETLSEYHRDLTREGNDNKKRGNSEHKRHDRQTFNSAEYLFVSTRLAKEFPNLTVAKAISHFRTPFPRRSYQHISDASESYRNSGSAFFFRSFGTIFLFMIGNYVNLPQGLQDGIIHGIAALGIGYTVILHAQLFDVFPAFAFIPIFVIAVIAHFYLKSRHQATSAKQVKGKVQPISNAIVDSKVNESESDNYNKYNIEDDDEYVHYQSMDNEDSSDDSDGSWNNSENYNDWGSEASDDIAVSLPSNAQDIWSSDSLGSVSIDSALIDDIDSVSLSDEQD